jgi:hypothetical protein
MKGLDMKRATNLIKESKGTHRSSSDIPNPLGAEIYRYGWHYKMELGILHARLRSSG